MKLVVKRYNIKGKWHGIRKAVQKTRAAISWRNAQLLQFYGIDTPAPIAMIEGRFGSRQRVSYFLSAYVAGTSCRDYFANSALSADDKRRIAKQAAELLAMLARLRIRHGDMKATNMIIARGRIYLIDLDGMQAYKTHIFFRRGLARDRERFRRNWEADTGTWRLFEESMERS
jgi:tRNA A-37 threonylcarbamoyl transferase component Bud32